MGYSLCTDKGLIELYWNPCLFYRSYSYAYHVERSLLVSSFWGFFFFFGDVCPELSHLYMTNESFQRLHASSLVTVSLVFLLQQNMTPHEKLVACKVD
jgi:hypothetical protein